MLEQKSDRPDSSTHGQFEFADGVQCVETETRELAAYFQAFQRTSLLEGYVNGELSLVLYADALLEIDNKGASPGLGVRTEFQNGSILVFHSCVSDCGVRLRADEQFVFIGDVEIVKSVKGGIPSSAWLYVGHDCFKDLRGSDVYFSFPKATFHFVKSFTEGKFSGAVDDAAGTILKASQVSVVDGAPIVVDGISERQGQLAEELRFEIRAILQRLTAVTLILDSGRVTLMKRSDSSLKIRDVLIGPIEL